MSLVNDMLLDLDNRTQTHTPEHLSGNKEYRPLSNQRMFWQGCAVVLVLVCGYMVYEYRRISGHAVNNNAKAAELVQPVMADAPTYSDSVPVTTETVVNSVVTVVKKEAAESISVQTFPETTFSEKKGDENSQAVDVPTSEILAADDAKISAAKVTLLLADAERALNANRLTSPLNDNAFNRYQTVLLLDANNPVALEGIQTLVKRYFEFYSAKLNEGEIKSAHFYLSKGKQVAAAYPSASAWLANALQQFSVEEKTTITVQNNVQPEVINSRSNTIDNISMSHEQATGESATVKITETASVNSRDAVSNEVVSRETAKRAQAAFNESQILIKQGDLDGAIALLETHQPAKNTNANYFSLLAALYQKVGRYEESVSVYQSLLSQDDSNATYWLGLAISLDAIPKTSNALQAFRYARLYGAGDSETQHYITERIAQLTQ